VQEPQGSIQLAPTVAVPASAVSFSFSSSSGPGGQNVNKRATKAELRVLLADLPIPHDALLRLAAMAGQRLTDAGELVIVSDEHRSQPRNKAECLARLRELIVRALVRPRKRRATRPSRGSVERRLEAKRRDSHIKRSRRAEE
jgi:ribosome-associated protein